MGRAVGPKPGEKQTLTCSVDGCKKLVNAHGLCPAHAHRLRRYGDPLGKPIAITTAERFWQKVDANGDCWIWTGARNQAGYGTFSCREQRIAPVRAHRWAWEYLIGKIGLRLQLDHLCRNRACVNPDHMEPVTNAENGRRGIRGRLHVPVSVCKYGHQLNGENLYVHQGVRYCRKCDRRRGSEYRARRRARQLDQALRP